MSCCVCVCVGVSVYTYRHMYKHLCVCVYVCPGILYIFCKLYERILKISLKDSCSGLCAEALFITVFCGVNCGIYCCWMEHLARTETHSWNLSHDCLIISAFPWQSQRDSH